MTRQELKLWRHLRQLRQLGYHFRRQVPIKTYIVDFACFHPRLIVEIDGSQHASPYHKGRDTVRDTRLRDDGFKIARVWNSDIDRNIEGVFTLILYELGSLNPPTPAAPRAAVPPHEGEG